MLRWLSLADVIGIPLLVQWAVWREGGAPHWVFYAIPLWLLGSFLLHRDTPKTLGMRADTLAASSTRDSFRGAGRRSRRSCW